MTVPQNPEKPDEIDFVITDYVQRLELFSAVGRGANADVGAAVRMAERFAAAVLVPVCGKAVQRFGTQGFDPDGFMWQAGTFRFAAHGAIERALVVGWLPEQHGSAVEITASCAGFRASANYAAGTQFSLELPLELADGTEDDFRIELSSSFQPSSLSPNSPDNRHLGCIVQFVQFD